MAYDRWKYAPRRAVLDAREREFRNTAAMARTARAQESWKIKGDGPDELPGTHAAREADRSGGGGFLGRIGGGIKDFGGGVKDVAGDIAKPVGGRALRYGGSALNKVLEGVNYVDDTVGGTLIPAFTDPVRDPETGEIRREFRLREGATNFGKDLFTLGQAGAQKRDIREENEVLGRESTSNLLTIMREARENSQQFQASENIPKGVRTGVSLMLSPTMYVGYGAIGKLGTKLAARGVPGAARLFGSAAAPATSRTARVAGALAEGPGGSRLPGMIAGASVGSEVADRVDVPGVPEAIEQLGGQLLGGGIGLSASSAVRGAERGARNLDARMNEPVPGQGQRITAGMAVDANKPGASTYTDVLDKYEVPYEYKPEGDAGAVVVRPDWDKFDQALNRADPTDEGPLMAIWDQNLANPEFPLEAPWGKRALGEDRVADAQRRARYEELANETWDSGGSKLVDGEGFPAVEPKRANSLLVDDKGRPTKTAKPRAARTDGRMTKSQRRDAARTAAGADDAWRQLSQDSRNWSTVADGEATVAKLVDDMREELRVAAAESVRQNRGDTVAVWDAQKGRYDFVAQEYKADGSKRWPEAHVSRAFTIDDAGMPSPAGVTMMGPRWMAKYETALGIQRDFRWHADTTLKGAAEPEATTVKRVDLEGNVTDTFKTEAEMAGIRPEQGAMDVEGRLESWKLNSETDVETPRIEPSRTDSSTSIDAAKSEPEIAKGTTEEPKAEPEFEAPKAEPEPEPAKAAPGVDEDMFGELPPLDRSSLHTILGIDPKGQFTEDELKKAYRAQARKYHPDVNKSATATEDMKAINDAYEKLAGQRGADSAGPRTAYEDPQQWQRERRNRYRSAQEEARQWHDEEYQRWKEWRSHPENRGKQGGGRADVPGVADEALPPRPPDREPGTPSPGSGKGGTSPFGDEPYDILDAQDSKKLLARNEAGNRLSNSSRFKEAYDGLPQSWKRVLGKVTDRIDTYLNEQKRTQHSIAHYIAVRTSLEHGAFRAANLHIRGADDGLNHLYFGADEKSFTDLGIAEDIIEGTTEAGRAVRDSLDEAGKAAIAEVEKTNFQINATAATHGVDVRLDDDILGTYFGRRMLSKVIETEGGTQTIEAARGAQQPRSVGANRVKSRVFTSVEEGAKEGFNLDNAWESRMLRNRGKLMMSQDAYVAGNLKPLAVSKPGSGFGLGSVNQPAFAGQWFKPEDAARIDAGLKASEKGALEKFAQINRVLTPLRASFDLSATLQQGMRLWLTNPKAASQYWWGVARSLFDDTVWDGMVGKFEQRAVEQGTTLEQLAQWGMRFTDESVEGEFFFSKKVLQKTGKVLGPLNKAGIKSNQHFGRLLNSYRLHSALESHKRFAANGLEGADMDGAMRSAMSGVNRMYGWTETDPTNFEKAALFAPRYFRASIETIMKSVEGVKNLGHASPEAALARNHMGLLLMEGAGAVWFLNMIRGEETEWDPTDANFLRIRNAGGLDISPFGTYNTLFRAMATVVGGKKGGLLRGKAGLGEGRVSPIERLGWGKMSPAAKIIYEPFVQKRTFLGEPLSLTDDPFNVIFEVGVSSLPFSVQNFKEEGGFAGVLGATGLSATPVTATERRNARREELAQEQFGQKFEDLSGADKSVINRDPGVQKQQEKADRRALTKDDDFAASTGLRQKTAEWMAAAASNLEAGKDPATGQPYTGNDYRETYHDMQRYMAGARDQLDFQGGDKDVNGWFDLYDKATLPTGGLNYDLLESLQAQYRETHPDIDAAVDKVTGTHDDATLARYRAAQKLAQQYYDLPAYRGMDVDDAQLASRYLRMATDMVAAGQARDRAHSLRILESQYPGASSLVRTALRRDTNPERKAFRRANPEFALFYSDIAPTVGS